MKQFIVLLFFSLLVSQINAAMMPIESNVASNSVMDSGHDHCQETASIAYSEDGKPSGNTNPTHYCCAIVAILMTLPAFSVPKQLDVYLQGDVSTPTSNIPESIYKPPEIIRNYF